MLFLNFFNTQPLLILIKGWKQGQESHSIQPTYLSSALADYYLLSIENIQLLCYLYLCLNWISVFFRSHTGNWSLLNEDCYSAQINGVQTKSTLRVSVTRFNLKNDIVIMMAFFLVQSF